MSLETSIERMFLANKARNYPKYYLAVDLHDTILLSNYKKGELGVPFPMAIKTLKALYERKEVCLILFTSCYEEDYEFIKNHLDLFGINFHYINENPECENTETGNFDKKFYYSLLLDDKAGFDPKTDWDIVYEKFYRRLLKM
jgi:hypothetical protein